MVSVVRMGTPGRQADVGDDEAMHLISLEAIARRDGSGAEGQMR